MTLEEVLQNKKGIYQKIKGLLWWIYDKRRPIKMFVFRKIKKYLRFFSFSRKIMNSYHFVIVCVKRSSYINLAIKNINSLHYINPSHFFTIYCDDICESAIQTKMWKFDYPQKIKINNTFGKAEKPWQYYKLETIIDISRKDWLLVDADALWHQDILIDRNKITFLAIHKKIRERKNESLIIKNIFDREDWLDFMYYLSGFLSIPSKFMTEKVASDSRTILEKLLNNKLDFLPTQQERDEQKRLSEQFAINLGVLTNLGENNITTLKEEENGPKDKNILQSLYFGTEQQITD